MGSVAGIAATVRMSIDGRWERGRIFRHGRRKRTILGDRGSEIGHGRHGNRCTQRPWQPSPSKEHCNSGLPPSDAIGVSYERLPRSSQNRPSAITVAGFSATLPVERPISPHRGRRLCHTPHRTPYLTSPWQGGTGRKGTGDDAGKSRNGKRMEDEAGSRGMVESGRAGDAGGADWGGVLGQWRVWL